MVPHLPTTDAHWNADSDPAAVLAQVQSELAAVKQMIVFAWVQDGDEIKLDLIFAEGAALAGALAAEDLGLGNGFAALSFSRDQFERAATITLPASIAADYGCRDGLDEVRRATAHFLG